MTDRDRYAPIEAEIHEQLSRCLEIVRPYARSRGRLNDYRDLRTAISLAIHALERAQLLADHKLPPTP
jgi:hypothetical protein